jgi:spermidine synthase
MLVISLMAGVVLSLVTGGAGRLDGWSERLQWHDHQLVRTARSPYSTIAVVRSAEQHTLFVNGSPAVSVPHPGPQVESLAHFPLLLHERPKRVLVVGGGAGGLLREVLKHPVAEVSYAEQDPLVLEMLARLPAPLTRHELTHHAVRVHAVEGRLFLKRERASWDVVIVNLPAPGSLMLNRYYTVEFFGLVRSRLAAGGILALSLPGSEVMLSQELADLNGTVGAALRSAFRHVRVLPGTRNLLLASDGEAFVSAWEPDTLEGRLVRRAISTDLVSGPYIRYRMDQARFGSFAERIGGAGVPNRDALPRATFAAMRQFSRLTSPGVARVLEAADRLPASAWAGGLAGLALILLAVQRWRRAPVYRGYAAVTAGFAGMVMSVALILAFQVVHGDVYQHIGVLTALFMLGAATGSIWAARRSGGELLALEMAFLGLLAAAWGGVVSGAWVAAGTSPIYPLTVLVGAMTGAQYSLVVACLGAGPGRIGFAAASVYLLDLAGAIAGAALAGIILIPTLGLGGAILLTAGLKGASALLILAWRWQGAR